MKKKILIVDDDPAIINLLQMSIKETYDVILAYNGKEALEKVNDHSPDLVLMDIMMPVMDGLEAMAKIKENPTTSTIPVILLTAKVQPKDVLEGYNNGADYYITKPFTSKELMNGINLCLGQAGQ